MILILGSKDFAFYISSSWYCVRPYYCLLSKEETEANSLFCSRSHSQQVTEGGLEAGCSCLDSVLLKTRPHGNRKGGWDSASGRKASVLSVSVAGDETIAHLSQGHPSNVT